MTSIPETKIKCHVCGKPGLRTQWVKQGWSKQEIPVLDRQGQPRKRVLYRCTACRDVQT